MKSDAFRGPLDLSFAEQPGSTSRLAEIMARTITSARMGLNVAFVELTTLRSDPVIRRGALRDTTGGLFLTETRTSGTCGFSVVLADYSPRRSVKG